MPTWKKNLVLVWLAQFLGLAGFWFAIPFIPYYIQELGASGIAERNAWVAVYAIAGYLSIAIFSPIWGGVADRYGRKSMLTRANLCNAIILPMMGFAPSLTILVLLRFTMGMFSGSTTAAQALVSSCTPSERRGFAIGALSSAIYTGTMVGCFLGGVFADHIGYRMSFWICGFMYLVAGLITIIGVREDFKRNPVTASKHRRHRKSSFFGLDLRPLRLAWLILTLILIMDLARKFDIPFLPLLVQEINHSMDGAASWTGVIFGVASAAGILAGPLLGLLADRYTPQKVAVISAITAAVFMALQGLAFNMTYLIVTRFIMVFAAGGLDPVFQIWLVRSTPDKIRGIIFGWSLTAKCAGWAIATMLCGSIATIAGLRWIYPVGAMIFLILVPIIIYTSRQVKSYR